MLTGSTGIASGQLLIHPECQGIHYTDNQDKRCLECLMNFSERDSLMQRLIENDLECDSILNAYNGQKNILSTQLSNRTKELNRANLKLKVSQNLVKFGIPGGFVLGFVVRSLIIKN